MLRSSRASTPNSLAPALIPASTASQNGELALEMNRMDLPDRSRVLSHLGLEFVFKLGNRYQFVFRVRMFLHRLSS